MAYSKIPQDKERWKKSLENAGFSHCDGKRIICYDCNLCPRSEEVVSNPAKLHAELCKECKYVKENDLCAKFLDESTFVEDVSSKSTDDNCESEGRILCSGNNFQNESHLPMPYILNKNPRTRSERSQELIKKSACMNCFTESHSYVFIPCRHVFCHTCAIGQSRCNKCRSSIERKERFYRA